MAFLLSYTIPFQEYSYIYHRREHSNHLTINDWETTRQRWTVIIFAL
jgi:hypothetical protein